MRESLRSLLKVSFHTRTDPALALALSAAQSPWILTTWEANVIFRRLLASNTSPPSARPFPPSSPIRAWERNRKSRRQLRVWAGRGVVASPGCTAPARTAPSCVIRPRPGSALPLGALPRYERAVAGTGGVPGPAGSPWRRRRVRRMLAPPPGRRRRRWPRERRAGRPRGLCEGVSGGARRRGRRRGAARSACPRGEAAPRTRGRAGLPASGRGRRAGPVLRGGRGSGCFLVPGGRGAGRDTWRGARVASGR